MTSVYRVTSDFVDAEAGEEMTVRTGEYIVQVGPVENGWIPGYKLNNPDSSGFAPASYMELVPAAEAQRLLAAAKSSSSSSAGPVSSAPSSSMPNMSSSAIPPVSSSSYSSSAAAIPTSITKSSSSSSLGSSGLAGGFSSAGRPQSMRGISSSSAARQPSMTPQQFADKYAMHEKVFSEIMKGRQAKFSQLENSIGETSRQIGECQRKNSELLNKIQELETRIVAEKKQWQEKLEVEKRNLLQRSASYGSSSVSAGGR